MGKEERTGRGGGEMENGIPPSFRRWLHPCDQSHWMFILHTVLMMRLPTVIMPHWSRWRGVHRCKQDKPLHTYSLQRAGL